MKLKSGLPYSLIKNGLVSEYPKLLSDKATEIVILGGGISGALSAYYLVKAGFSCIVVDARSIGLGSTCASILKISSLKKVFILLLLQKTCLC